MAIVLEFPKKKELPKEIEAKLQDVAKNYVETLYVALSTLTSDNPTQEELVEVHEMVSNAYIQGLTDAINEIEES